MEKGLTSQKAVEKLRTLGKNEISTKESKSSFHVLLSQFPTFINLI